MKNILRGCITLFIFILIWQRAVVMFQVPVYLLPSPAVIFQTLQTQAALLSLEFLPTLLETLAGLVLAFLIGVMCALFIFYIKPAKHWVLPLLVMSQAMPTFALAPLLTVWLGYGFASKIVMTFIMVFFPITSSVLDGLTTTPRAYLDLAYTMNMSRLKTLWHIQLPAALPQMASGLRIAATLAPMGAVIGEWVGSDKGLGFLMLNANARMNTPLMFASLITLLVLTLFLYYFIDILFKRIITWR